MRLIDVVSAPWAITPDMFSEVQGVYARHMRGDKIDLESIEARIGVPLNNARHELVIQDGIAIIAIEGLLAKRMNLLMTISGGTSMQIAGQQVRSAAEDPTVKAIILAIDSPGGTVDGTEQLGQAVFDVRGKKPIVAVADGAMMSAAYWVGCAADRVYIANRTTAVGSIGCLGRYVDTSRAERNAGIDTTEIKAGRYKSSGGPLTTDLRNALQEQVDQAYAVFVDTVALCRDVDRETVLKNMADGRVFIGQQAIDAGLVDGVATLEQVVATMRDTGAANRPARMTALDGVSQTVATNGEDPMTITVESLKKDHPDVAKALIAEGHPTGREEGVKAGKAEGIVEGAMNERGRIKAVLEQTMPGHEALVQGLAFDGQSTAGEAAIKVLNADREKRQAKAGDLREDAAVAKVAPALPEGAQKKQPDADAHGIARRAQAYQAEQEKLGTPVSAAQAVAHVMSQKEG